MGSIGFHRASGRWVGAALVALSIAASGGCITRFLSDEPGVAQRLEQAPPVTIGAINDKHLVTMRAPNPGWSLMLDATERTPEGKRVYLTFRAPDPALYYPQRLVFKRVLTQVRTDTPLTLAGRVLDHDADAEEQPYATLTPVESFE